MGRLSVFALVVAVFSCIVTIDASKSYAEKLAVLQRDASVAALAIRNVTIRGPRCRRQIASMANDFIFSLDNAKQVLNNVIPNIPSAEKKKYLVDGAQFLTDLVNNIQRAIPGDAEQLKEKLISTLDELSKVAAITEDSDIGLDNFANIQVLRENHFIMLGINKLRYRALLFDKPNKELEPELRQTVSQLNETFNSLSNTGEDTRGEIHRLLENAMVLTAIHAYRLQNWVQVNSNKTEDVQLIQSVSKLLGSLHEREVRALDLNNGVHHMTAEFLNVYETVLGPAIKVAHIQHDDILAGQEFLRSFLIETIAFGRFYSAYLKGDSNAV